MSGQDPEETTPFTHRPYGSKEPPQEPFASSEPPREQPTWETYEQPASPPYPSAPYGQSPYGQSPYGQSPYSQPGYGRSTHPDAHTAMVLGIVALAGTFVCGILCVVGPFAWAKGAKARREIDANPQQWGGRSEATIGFVTGIIATLLMALALLVVFVAVVLVAAGSA